MSPLVRAAIAALIGALAVARADAAAPEACRGRDLSQIEGLAAAKAKRAGELVNGDGLLWRIEKPGLAPSWLYGTMHSTDPSAIEMARRAARQIEGAKVVATELGGPFDPLEKTNIGAAMLARALDRDRDTFEGAVAPADREPVEKLLAGAGYPAELAHHLKLWFLAILASAPSCEIERAAAGKPEVDEVIAKTAKDLGVKVIGLETAQEQLDVIASMKPDVAATLLTLSAREPGVDDDLYVTMLSLYRVSRPADILPISDMVGGVSDEERAAQNQFMKVLLAGRNATMAERAAPLLAAGGAFIAVGALHLCGVDGLIERFRAMGYSVTKEW